MPFSARTTLFPIIVENHVIPLSFFAEPEGRARVRAAVAGLVLDTSMEAVLVRSKEAVLDAIRWSPDMQAAFRAYEVATDLISIRLGNGNKLSKLKLCIRKFSKYYCYTKN